MTAAVVHTARLVLTPVGVHDVDDLAVLYGDPDVARWTGPWTPDVITAWAEDMAVRWARDGVGKWMARCAADGALIGRGYATEIGRAALTWAREHHPDLPVVAFTEVHHHASRAVMERLGMVRTGTIRRPGLVEGREGLRPDAPFALYELG